MNVNINLKPSNNESKWNAIENGDYAVLASTPEHPLPNGLYRIFFVPAQENEPRNLCLMPLFDGPFTEGMFPMFVPAVLPLPKLIHKIIKITVEAEVNEA